MNLEENTFKKCNRLWKEKRATVNKNRTKITLWCKIMLHLWKKVPKKLAKKVKVRGYSH